jgi:hypothetical protein
VVGVFHVQLLLMAQYERASPVGVRKSALYSYQPEHAPLIKGRFVEVDRIGNAQLTNGKDSRQLGAKTREARSGDSQTSFSSGCKFRVLWSKCHKLCIAS